MRVKLTGELGKVWPENAQLNIKYYEERAASRGLQKMSFMVDGLPLSLNSQYDITLKFCKPGTPGAFRDKSGRWRVRSHRLKAGAIDWRVVCAEAMGEKRWNWRPTGVTAAVILFETPEWLCQDRTVRAKDADNLVKPALDAVQSATEVPDELFWSLHVFKIQSKRKRTTVFLYDLGDIIEFFY